MKKIFVPILLLFVFSMSNAQILFTLGGHYYEPFPVQPGERMDIWISFYNRGNDEVTDLTLQVEDSYPFTLYDESQRLENFGKIVPGEKVLKQYTLFVDANADQGTNYVKVSYKLKSTESWKTVSIPVSISSYRYYLDIQHIYSDDMSSGESSNIVLEIKNNGDKTFRNVQLAIELTDVPLTTFSSVTKQTIDSIEPGQVKNVTFQVIADLDIKDSVYDIPLTLSYQDLAKNTYTEFFNFGVLIKDEPKLRLVLDGKGYFSNAKQEDVLIKTINFGKSKATFLDVTLLPSDDYQILSSSYDYVGEVQSDDFEFSSFKIFVQNGEEIELKLKVSYKDQYNHDYVEYQSIFVTVYNHDDLKSLGFGNGDNSWLFIGLILFSVLAYYLYKKKVKKR